MRCLFTTSSQNPYVLKQSWRDEYLKWICGFTNAEGGKLYIGIGDNGEITDVKNSKKLLTDIPNKVRDVLDVIVDVKMRQKKEKKYIEITAEPCPYPVSYKGEYHCRTSSTKQLLKGAALDKFLLGKQGRCWDSVPVPHVTASKLDKDTVVTGRCMINKFTKKT